MKEHVKDLWVAALLSGEYKQTQSVLHDGDGYCCLGVLCRVLGKQFVIDHAPTKHERDVYLCEDSNVLLPRSVQDEAGMKSDSGVLPASAVADLNVNEEDVNEEEVNWWSLADLNDRGAAFDEIADVISKHWETL